MAKNKAKKRASKPSKVPRPTGGLRLHDAAVRYANLLADPCNGDLVPGPFGDGYGGMVARFEKEYIINNSSTDTAAAFVFNPFSGLVAWQTTPMVDDTNPVAWTVPAGSISHPGNSFLTANASWNRCLAACVQVYYPGSELSRAGVVSLGQYPAEVVNDTAAVATFRQMANYVVRTPSDCAEIVWRPNHADLLGREPIPLPSVLSNMAGTNTTSLVVTAAGLPVTTGIRIRVVAVYEWMPDPLAGFKNTVVRNPNPVTLGQVLSYLDRTGDWMAGTARAAGKAVSSLAHGVASIYQLGNGASRIGRALLT